MFGKYFEAKEVTKTGRILAHMLAVEGWWWAAKVSNCLVGQLKYTPKVSNFVYAP